MADDSLIGGVDLGGLPAKKLFEIIDGTLWIDGACHGRGPHARVLLDLIAHPPSQPEPQREPRLQLARYTVTEMPPRAGTIDGLQVVVDDGQPAIYGYLQHIPRGAVGGHDQILLPLDGRDLTSPEQQEAALQAFNF